MTQQSRRRKAAQRERRLSSRKKSYFFAHTTRNVEVVAPDLREAQSIFMEKYGYHPGAPIESD